MGEDLESYNKAPSTFGTSGGPLVNAQCGTSANSTGTVGSNTLMVGSVMNPVTVKDDASAPYQLKGTAVTDPVEAGEAGSIAVTANEVTAALRGQTEFVTTVDFYKKKTPIGCIGRDVRFSNIEVTIDGGKKMVYTFCDPSGYKGASNPDDSLATNTNLYDVNMKTAGSITAGSYFATVFGTGTTGTGGTNANAPDTTAAITVAQAKQMSRGPTWLWLRQVRRVAVPTRLVLLRLLPGTVLRLSWLHATAPTAPLQESWPLLVSFLWLKRLSACSQ